MQLQVINSGSKANTYLLIADNGETVIIDQGCSYVEISKAIDFQLNNVVVMLCSHSHGDHSKSTKQLMAAGIDCIISKEEYEVKHIKGADHRAIFANEGEIIKLGVWEFLPFNVIHDSPKPLGFLIRHPEMGVTCYITDSCYLPVKFNGLTNIIVEANYCESILKNRFYDDKLHPVLKDRVIKSHMSIQTCQQFLAANDLSNVINIVLIHLSDTNSNAAEFQQKVEKQTGKQVFVGLPGLDIEFNATPF